MALSSGTNNESTKTYDSQQNTESRADSFIPPAPLAFKEFASLLCFFIFTGLGLAIIAGLVLAPSYQQLKELEYQRSCQNIELQEAKLMLNGYKSLVKDILSDETLNRRLAYTHLGMLPGDQDILTSFNREPIKNPASIPQVKLPLPQRPKGLLVDLANFFNNPEKKVGLFILAGAIILGSLLLFTPVRKKYQPTN